MRGVTLAMSTPHSCATRASGLLPDPFLPLRDPLRGVYGAAGWSLPSIAVLAAIAIGSARSCDDPRRPARSDEEDRN